MMPATPMARARVSASMSSRAPATRMPPGRADVDGARAQLRVRATATARSTRPTTGCPQPTGPRSPMPLARMAMWPAATSSTTPVDRATTTSMRRPRQRPRAPRASAPTYSRSGPVARARRGAGPRPGRLEQRRVELGARDRASPRSPRSGSSSRSVSRACSMTGWPTRRPAPRRRTSARSPGRSAGAPSGCRAPSGSGGARTRRARASPLAAGQLAVAGVRRHASARPDRALPGLEQRPTALGALGQPERHLAGVHQQAAQAAGHVERDAAGADTQHLSPRASRAPRAPGRPAAGPPAAARRAPAPGRAAAGGW